ncbi:zinc finger protein ZFP2-like isoform X2 [Galleria mellonella]|uniref:Zinc finger protein ZFP2-like isoform X2 n=1 Tax=Galleria mellonella TaxID=7137 RepID=A0ABM3MA80_GALME|nr:zinc finger protein ZFP2-like isoform X2 [Galleria mellonella]
MEDIEIKHEFVTDEQELCRTCLSVGRRLVPLEKYAHIFEILIADCQPAAYTNKLQVCWECEALLCKVIQFQQQVRRANEMLQTGGQNYIYGTLSNLTSVVINDSYPHTVYVNQTNAQTSKHMNTYSSDDNMTEDTVEMDFKIDGIKVEPTKNEPEPQVVRTQFQTEPGNVLSQTNIQDKKSKSNNKWAKKRALQNKKPKFKMADRDKAFTKVHVSSEELREHVEREKVRENYKSVRFKCDSCMIGFDKEIQFNKHKMKHHIKNLLYICDICNTSKLNKRRLSAHMRKHYCKYVCSLCKFTGYNKKDINMHMKAHKKAFECLKCGLMFGKQHNPFECKPCNKRFARYNGLWLHNKTHHMKEPAAAAYCVECDKRFPDIYRYRWHLANSARHKPAKKVRVPCPGCEKVFSKNIYMKDHYNMVHLKYYKYHCEECDKNFIRNADLVKHKRRVHDGILPPRNKICYVCGKGFTTNKILTNHIRTHTGERPYSCTRCSVQFAHRAALRAHQQAHDEPPKAGGP